MKKSSLWILFFVSIVLAPLHNSVVFADPIVNSRGLKGWPEERFRNTGILNMNDYCNSSLNHSVSDSESQACHHLDFLEVDKKIISYIDNLPSTGIQIIGAFFSGNIDIRRRRYKTPLILKDCIINGAIIADDAVFDRDLALINVSIGLGISAPRARMLENFYVDKKTDISGFGLFAEQCKIEGDFIAKFSSIAKIDLSRCQIQGDISIETVSANYIKANRVSLSGQFDLRNYNGTGVLEFAGAHIGGDVRLMHADLGGRVTGYNSFVAGTLEVGDNTTASASVEFIGLHIKQNVEIKQTKFYNNFTLALCHIEQGIDINSVIFACAPDLGGTLADSYLNISGSTLPGLNLTRANIIGDFRIANETGETSAIWTDGAMLRLGHAHIGVVQDANNGDLVKYWPNMLDLEGVKIGAFGTSRNARWGSSWLGRDANASEQPYQELAAIFKQSGSEDEANEILHSERDRELRHSWSTCAFWRADRCLHAGVLMLEKTIIGYGIGSYIDYAFYWAIFLILNGALILRFTKDKPCSFAWRLGASINKLIPVMDLNKEFSVYFEDPERHRFHHWQFVYFCFHAAMGYALAFFIAAAFAGLTQAH